jgi:hypothetical protein
MCIQNNNVPLPVSMAKQSKACTVCDCSNIGITGSNPALGMDVCPHVSVLCCPVLVEALCQADPPSKESYQNVSLSRSRKPIRVGQRSAKDCKCLCKQNVTPRTSYCYI